MFDTDPVPEPDAVLQARRRSRNGTLAVVGATLAFFPLIAASKALGLSADIAVYSYLGILGVAAALAPWRQYSQDLQTIQEHQRYLAQQKLGIKPGTPVAQATSPDPLSALSSRILALAEQDGAIPGLVQGVMARRADLQRDLSSLEEALALEAEMDGVDNPRLARLVAVAQSRRVDLQRLGDALRDLHVELTVRSDADHTAVVERVDHMLASLSAEAELAALGGEAGTPDPEGPRRQPRRQRQRDG